MSQKTVEPACRQVRQAECASGRSQDWSDTMMELRSEFGPLGKPDGVPVKMQKTIWALRERCLVTDRFGRKLRLGRVVVSRQERKGGATGCEPVVRRGT